MHLRRFSVFFSVIFILVALPQAASGYKDSFDVFIDGVRASGTTVLVSFKPSLDLRTARDALRREGFSVRSFHTFFGTSHPAGELVKRGGFDTGDLSFTLVEFSQMSLAEALEKLIRKYSEKAQYLVISHNDYMIQEASTLFGVSMTEHGISKVVSLRV